MPLLILPSAICTGDIISYANSLMDSKAGRMTRFTFAGSVFFNRMIEKNLYTIDTKEIENRIKKLNLENIFSTKLI